MNKQKDQTLKAYSEGLETLEIDQTVETWISYGGGVQTFGMLVMVKDGLIPKPNGLIFSNTMAEYPATYAHIEQIVKPICEELDIPFIEVFEGEGLIEGYKENNSIPLAGFRTCTMKFKVDPIRKFFRERYNEMGIKRRGKAIVNMLIGISTDEAGRVLPRSKQKPKWILNTYPFIEMDFSRRQIIDYIEKSGYPVPIKSGCYVCPYNGLKGFVELKTNHPQLFQIAVDMEENMFRERPDRRSGFLGEHKVRLIDLKSIPSLFDFVDQLPEGMGQCENKEGGGCFL